MNNETIFFNREVCRKFGSGSHVWAGINLFTGITKTSGDWRYPNGRSLGAFQLNWYPGYPKSSNGYDFMIIYCGADSNFGKIFNYQKTATYKFLCQN